MPKTKTPEENIFFFFFFFWGKKEINPKKKKPSQKTQIFPMEKLVLARDSKSFLQIQT